MDCFVLYRKYRTLIWNHNKCYLKEFCILLRTTPVFLIILVSEKLLFLNFIGKKRMKRKQIVLNQVLKRLKFNQTICKGTNKTI